MTFIRSGCDQGGREEHAVQSRECHSGGRASWVSYKIYTSMPWGFLLSSSTNFYHLPGPQSFLLYNGRAGALVPFCHLICKSPRTSRSLNGHCVIPLPTEVGVQLCVTTGAPRSSLGSILTQVSDTLPGWCEYGASPRHAEGPKPSSSKAC
jgi:hypothetical protein